MVSAPAGSSGRFESSIIDAESQPGMTARTPIDRWSLAALGLVAIGLALRTLVAYPEHRYPADADCLLTGLCAFQVLRGEMPVFFAPGRIGSVECHLTAGLFPLFGASRGTLALGALLVSGATMLVAYRFFRTLFGPPAACLALLFLALPAPAYLFWTYMPNGYPGIVLFCALSLWLAARLVAGTQDGTSAFGLGLAGGLGLWQSLLTLGCFAPALAWVVLVRPDLWRKVRWMLLLGLGFALGASPWLLFHLRGEARESFASRPIGEVSLAASNLYYLATVNLPELVASTDPEAGLVPPGRVQRALHIPVLLIHGTAALLFLAIPFLRRARGTPPVPLPAWLLFVLVAAAIAAVNMVSEAGLSRGLTVRYILPLYLLAPPLLALLVQAVGRRSRPAAAALAAAVLAFNLAGTLAGEPNRQSMEEVARNDQRLVRFLEEQRIGAVLGGYWTVYPVNFLSRERILAIPCRADHDHHGIREKWRGRMRWALVAPSEFRGQLEALASAAGLRGRIEPVEPFYAVFLPAGSPPPRGELDRVQALCESRGIFAIGP